MQTETIVWSPLPNGHVGADARTVLLSVFVSPKLESTSGAPTLELFPHWRNWPSTVQASGGPLPFEVLFEGYPPVTVSPDTTVLSPAQWSAVFDPQITRVDSYTYTDYSTYPVTTFSVADVAKFVSGIYGTIGAATPLRPPLVVTSSPRESSFAIPESVFELVGASSGPYLDAYKDLVALAGTSGNPAVNQACAFHVFPEAAATFVPTVAPVLDFHTAISALASFPSVLESFGLVFRLQVPLPEGLTPSSSLTPVVVQVKPAWDVATSEDVTIINVAMSTQAELSTDRFLASPRGPFYRLNMLELSKRPPFSVVELDVDGAAESLTSTAISVQSLASWLRPLEQPGAEISVPVPALRSIGPSIVWSGWGQSSTHGGTGSLSALTYNQTQIQNAVSGWVNWYQHPVPKPPEPTLPVLRAEDITRGHRFDVHDETEPTPAWRSLHERIGTYTFGTGTSALTTTLQDEGMVVPGATQPTSKSGTSAQFYVHESIARWAGWSLSAPRPGGSIAPDDTVDESPTNPVATNTDPLGNQNPQMSVNFKVLPGSLPKLRYGRKYRYRARAVDMGGHSLPVTSTDATSATAPITHYRYEPVASPVVVPVAPFGPGEAAFLVPILDYQDGRPIAPNGRWLFPPKASQMMVEEHGMLDGYVEGSPPNPHAAPTPAAYALLATRTDGRIEGMPGAQKATSPGGGSYYYLPAGPSVQAPSPTSTPWLPDPLSSGAYFQSLPVPSYVKPAHPEIAALPWAGGIWPGQQPALLVLEAGPSPSNELLQATASTAALVKVTLPPASVANIFISSTISAPALGTLGVWSWILPNLPAADRVKTTEAAILGLLWMLTPYKVVRLVHAVRVPLLAPALRAPVVHPRAYGSAQATITDAAYELSEPSTASVNVEAAWVDPVDDLSKPGPQLVKTSQHAFKLVVPDPLGLGPEAQAMKVVAPARPFALYPGGGGAVHTIGDTKHHAISYTCTGISRFVEFFRTSATKVFSSASPLTIDPLGLDPNEVVVAYQSTVLETKTDYTLDAKNGTIAVTNSHYWGKSLDLTWVPADTATGKAHVVQVLSSARPAAPKVAKVTPAWSVSGVGGSLASGGISYARTGGYLRVYLERPWFSSGVDERLGVVSSPPGEGSFYAGLSVAQQAQWVTTMGLDPVSVSSGNGSYPLSPSSFTGTVPVPVVPYRPAYSSPPRLQLVENSGPGAPVVSIWPFEVHYDTASQLWFADVGITIGTGESAPPPGYFVRLALVRFQPYAFPGAEISTVTLATFAQPVVNRAVSVTKGPGANTVKVTVTGPGYYGYRPLERGKAQIDVDNPGSEHPYSAGPYPASSPGTKTTSMMLVEVQAQDTSKGLSGELAWTRLEGTSPVPLAESFSGGPEVTWSGVVRFAQPSKPLRLRISEIDYPTAVPGAVNSSLRRTFVAFIPLDNNPALHTAPK
ncbi:MAG TPA: hypothetical protein VME20_08825 [Acidimicrobiales bacterium]|nr:hypothetical protein [Acidimicrobiales bacterium]